MINKNFILILLVLSLFFIVGCSNFGKIDVSNLSEEDVNKIIVCNKPYMRFGTGCCLDANDNKICDNDEKGEIKTLEPKQEENTKPEIKPTQPISCKNECTQDSCDVNIYYQCVKQADGCYDKINKGKIIGKCNVNCLKDSDCASGQECYYSGLNQFYVCQDKQPSQAGYDLSKYPEPFIDFNNKKFNYQGVVGADSAAIDNLALSDITAGLSSIEVEGKPLANYDVAPAGMLDVQITNPEQYNLILVGRPSENRLTAKLLGLTYPAYGEASGLKTGEATIILKQNGNKVALLVFGWAGEDTQRAGTVLKNYEAYKGKLTGTEVKVSGTTASPTIVTA